MVQCSKQWDVGVSKIVLKYSHPKHGVPVKTTLKLFLLLCLLMFICIFKIRLKCTEL